MTILTKHGIEKIDVKPGRSITATIKLPDGKIETRDFSHVIVAVGILPNTENIGLEALGVKTERGHVVTDATCQTNVPGLYAIGVTPAAPCLGSKRAHEGTILARACLGLHSQGTASG